MANGKPARLTEPTAAVQPLIARPGALRAAVTLVKLDTKIPYTDIKGFLGLLLVSLVTYAVLILAIGAPFLPDDGPLWGLCLLWFCSHLGGWICTKCFLPPSLGMVLAGCILQNIGTHPLQGLPAAWMTRLQVAGFGFALTHTSAVCSAMNTSREKLVSAWALACLPLLLEAGMVALLFGVVFHMPPLLALAGGFAVGGASPEAFMAGILRLSHKGFGLASGIPILGAASSGVNACTAAAFFAMFAALALPERGRGGLDAAQLPLSALLGAGAGAVGALLCSCTRLWRSALQRLLALGLCCQALLFLGFHFDFIGAGVIAVWLCAAGAVHLWNSAQPALVSQPGADELQKLAEVDGLFGSVWGVAMQPLLFGCAGALVSGSALPQHTLAKALLLVCAGLAVRMTATLLSMLWAPLTWREAGFLALSWTAKGGHQALLGGLLLDMLLRRMPGTSTAQVQQQVSWCRQIASACMLDIVVGAPFAALVMLFLGPRALEQDTEAIARTQGFGSSTTTTTNHHSASHLPQPRRPAPSAPTQADGTQPSHTDSSASGNPFLDVELSTPTKTGKDKAGRLSGIPLLAGNTRHVLHYGPSSPSGVSGGQSKTASPRHSEIDAGPDSYSAIMTPSDSPTAGLRSGAIGARRSAAGGNPFAALGQAGRALAARFQTYKPLRLPSGLPAGESDAMLQQNHPVELPTSRSGSYEVELMASPRESVTPRTERVHWAADDSQQGNAPASQYSGHDQYIKHPVGQPSAEFIKQVSSNLVKFPSSFGAAGKEHDPEAAMSHATPMQTVESRNPFDSETGEATKGGGAPSHALEFTVSSTFELQEVDEEPGQASETGWRGPEDSQVPQAATVQATVQQRNDLSSLPWRGNPMYSFSSDSEHAAATPGAAQAVEAGDMPVQLTAWPTSMRKSETGTHPQPDQPAPEAPAVMPPPRIPSRTASSIGREMGVFSVRRRTSSGVVGLTRFGRSDADRTWAALQGASQALQAHANSIRSDDDDDDDELGPENMLVNSVHDVLGDALPSGSSSTAASSIQRPDFNGQHISDTPHDARTSPDRTGGTMSNDSRGQTEGPSAATEISSLSHEASRPGQHPAPLELGPIAGLAPLRSNRKSWDEAKQAAKRAALEGNVDSGLRGLMPPEVERARHAHEDVDTPANSPRQSPKASARRTTFEEVRL